MEGFLQKKKKSLLIMTGQKRFWQKKLWEVVLNRMKTNDRIMRSFGRSFIND